MMITIYQPEHLPWLGYFNKMAKAEVYVILDDVVAGDSTNYPEYNREME